MEITSPKDYLTEIQKFTTSHYWNSGVRITTGVIVPMLIMVDRGWLSTGIPFLFGALFVSLTDTPGPIVHRRNGMFAAITLNAFTVLVTSWIHDYQALVIAEVAIFSFLFAMLGIYGARAGAVGTLAVVIMLIHLSPLRQSQEAVLSAALTAAGGLWYAVLSLALYRIQPYRLAEQALGENLMMIGSYIRARAAFYKEGADVETVFTRVMKEQVTVLKSQAQIRELLFKTRQLVGDASPRSRSIMMIFLESLDLFEETMYSYQDYKILHRDIPGTLLNTFYSMILQIVAEFEHIGLAVQSGIVVKKMPSLAVPLDELERAVRQFTPRSPSEEQSIEALRQTLNNIRGIINRLSKIVLYTRMEAHDPDRFPDQDLEKPAGTQPMTLSLFRENLTIHSNTFRYATRITVALLAGYAISALFTLSHAYWVMLTIVTILKPVYNLTRARNIQRVLGTLAGVLLGSAILFVISNSTVLIVIMILCMLMAYSLLRVNYFGFVTFVTAYIIITFHFLNPLQFKSLIGERLIDTLIGSVIAAIAARFVFPVWQQHQIQNAMKKVLVTNTTYFLSAWNAIRDPLHVRQYNGARNEAIVALTNLSDNFQQMLAEPGQGIRNSSLHQFVIASHILTSRISSLTAKDLTAPVDTQPWINAIIDTLQRAAANLESPTTESTSVATLPSLPALHPLSIIFSLSRDIQTITSSIQA